MKKTRALATAAAIAVGLPLFLAAPANATLDGNGNADVLQLLQGGVLSDQKDVHNNISTKNLAQSAAKKESNQ
ncbi:hypothetical protein [Streptomyces sp. WAC01280]|uniref:hypothetical protein n=1 Tax=Streptomyces sp. WAC01280 TaxID=2487424 RepID=UPI000F77922D|nr:hypothetical protein [Streptomyces sp. WAC01280]RSS57371.1 hypothetical protein EF909_15430 [Streptomyces sp. WAC01280]